MKTHRKKSLLCIYYTTFMVMVMVMVIISHHLPFKFNVSNRIAVSSLSLLTLYYYLDDSLTITTSLLLTPFTFPF